MEVLMGRYGRRISRSLIGILIVTLVLGLAFYLKNTKTSGAEETASNNGKPTTRASESASAAAAIKLTTPTVAANPATHPQQSAPSRTW